MPIQESQTEFPNSRIYAAQDRLITDVNQLKERYQASTDSEEQKRILADLEKVIEYESCLVALQAERTQANVAKTKEAFETLGLPYLDWRNPEDRKQLEALRGKPYAVLPTPVTESLEPEIQELVAEIEKKGFSATIVQRS